MMMTGLSSVPTHDVLAVISHFRGNGRVRPHSKGKPSRTYCRHPDMNQQAPSKRKGPSGAQVARALEYVNYSNSMMANPEVAKKSVGGMTILAFAEGDSPREDTAPFDAVRRRGREPHF